MEIKKTEEMKISALKNEMNKHINVKRRQKIEDIIHQYEGNIKFEENRNLLEKNLSTSVIKNKWSIDWWIRSMICYIKLVIFLKFTAKIRNITNLNSFYHHAQKIWTLFRF